MSEAPETAAGMGPVFDNDMAEILESFIVETREILDRLGQDLILLEKGNSGEDLLNSIFRAVHTIKGTSSFLGLEQMTELAHVFEDVLNKLRRKELTLRPENLDVMLEAYDIIKDLLRQIEEKKIRRVDLTYIMRRLREIGRVDAAPLPPPPQNAAVLAETTPPGPGSQPPKTVDTTIRVDVTRLDGLLDLVGELVLGRNRLTQIASSMMQEHEHGALSKELSETSAQIDFITTELQMAVMKTRMLPVAKVFNKLPRLVRDLAKETGKLLELTVYGEDTELDKSILEELNDPLIHLLRNAADHGIESPDARRTAGKPETGRITVRAEHEGNHIVISVADDGAGMDPEKLKKKAVEKGLMSEAQVRGLGRTEAFNLIFGPGFSTAAKVTNVSGRGVGMDVVRTNITRLKGIIEVESEHGKGSTIIIKLPLTLAIIQALLVEVAHEVFSVPLESVLEVVRMQPKDIRSVNGREVVRLRNAVLPLARLHAVMGAAANGKGCDWVYIVVVGLADQRLGIVVDSLLGQKEVVIKSMGNYLKTLPGIAGSTILGDGRVIMIIDVGELMKLCAERQ